MSMHHLPRCAAAFQRCIAAALVLQAGAR
ncbi:hypothetical protein XOCgx_4131 [Xanthomonas oryzae pv. oryzicola]|nr:hypothetical protein XOCgx_4131 [Xanthomonas oryzae pv. oryzicola]